MAKLAWHESGKKFYENGVDRGVLFVRSALGTYPSGVAWNGLIAVNEKPSGAEATAKYADNVKYLNLISAEEFACGIEAFYSPEEFDECDGTAEIEVGVSIGQQTRKTFGFSYRTRIGNDVNEDLGYKIHLVYGADASPTERNRQTINESKDAMTVSWDVTTTPVPVTGYKPTAHLVIDSTKVVPADLAAFELVLYGDTSTTSRLPLPDEVASMFN